ncbi:hypothetical protein [Laspinema palackyanum]|uniref:hypothetical protein n=1 Tax=Laspinema palackyanum TaxID=3231601 RepID=UPI00345D5280|nr:hypothetical protein [Laspinema sp. D2c]
MYALQPNSSQRNRHHSPRQTTHHSCEAVALTPEQFCDKFLSLRYPGEKLDYKSGRRARCIRFLRAVLEQYTTQQIQESRVKQWGSGLSFEKMPSPFPEFLSLLAAQYPDALHALGRRF